MEENIKKSFNRIETIMNNEVCEFNKTIIEGNLNVIKRYIENLIQENKELKEKVKGMYDKSNKLIEVTNLYLNSVPRSKIINLLENEVIDISGFECIPARDLQELLVEGE